MITTMRHALAAVLVLAAACGPSIEATDEDDDVPRDEYTAFDVRYPQGSTPDQVVLVWGLEVDDWCESESARQVDHYGAVIVTECAPIDELWCARAGGSGDIDCYRTEDECGPGCERTGLD